jgi:hypothetical protein
MVCGLGLTNVPIGTDEAMYSWVLIDGTENV